MPGLQISRSGRINDFLSCLSVLMLFACTEKLEPGPAPFQIDIRGKRAIYLPVNSTVLSASSANQDLGDGTKFQFRWDCIQVPAGEPQPVFGSPDRKETAVYSLGSGTYIFRLRATGPLGLQAEDTLGLQVLPDSLQGIIKIYDAYWTTIDGAWNPLVVARLSVPEFAERPDGTLQDVAVDTDATGQWTSLYWEFKKNVLTVHQPMPLDDDSVNWDNYYKLVGRHLRVRVRF